MSSLGLRTWRFAPRCWIARPDPVLGWRREHGRAAPFAPRERRVAPGQPGHAAGAVLRPGLRAGDHAVHGADGRRADVAGAGEGRAGARRAVVVVGRLLVADE